MARPRQTAPQRPRVGRKRRDPSYDPPYLESLQRSLKERQERILKTLELAKSFPGEEAGLIREVLLELWARLNEVEEELTRFITAFLKDARKAQVIQMLKNGLTVSEVARILGEPRNNIDFMARHHVYEEQFGLEPTSQFDFTQGEAKRVLDGLMKGEKPVLNADRGVIADRLRGQRTEIADLGALDLALPRQQPEPVSDGDGFEAKLDHLERLLAGNPTTDVLPTEVLPTEEGSAEKA